MKKFSDVLTHIYSEDYDHITLQHVKSANDQWFAPGNKKFFHDVSYWLRKGKKTKKYYLVRSTYAWTDMFGGPRTLHYRINEIGEGLKIGKLIEKVFTDKEEVADWLAEN